MFKVNELGFGFQILIERTSEIFGKIYFNISICNMQLLSRLQTRERNIGSSEQIMLAKGGCQYSLWYPCCSRSWPPQPSPCLNPGLASDPINTKSQLYFRESRVTAGHTHSGILTSMLGVSMANTLFFLCNGFQSHRLGQVDPVHWKCLYNIQENFVLAKTINFFTLPLPGHLPEEWTAVHKSSYC